MKDNISRRPKFTGWVEFIRPEDPANSKYRSLVVEITRILDHLKKFSERTNLGIIPRDASNFSVLGKIGDLDIKSFNLIYPERNVWRKIYLSLVYCSLENEFIGPDNFDVLSKKIKLKLNPYREGMEIKNAVSSYFKLIGDFDPSAIHKSS